MFHQQLLSTLICTEWLKCGNWVLKCCDKFFFFIWIVQPSEWVRSSNESPKSCLFCNSVIYLFSLIIITKMLWISFNLLDWCKRDNTFYCMDFSIQFFFTFLISGFWYIQLYSFIFLVMLPNFWMPWWVGVCGEL